MVKKEELIVDRIMKAYNTAMNDDSFSSAAKKRLKKEFEKIKKEYPKIFKKYKREGE